MTRKDDLLQNGNAFLDQVRSKVDEELAAEIHAAAELVFDGGEIEVDPIEIMLAAADKACKRAGFELFSNDVRKRCVAGTIASHALMRAMASVDEQMEACSPKVEES